MIHEVLLALIGNVGGLINEKENGKLEVVSDIPFLHPCEISVVQDLLSLASLYKAILRFCDRFETNGSKENGAQSDGWYLSRLAVGLRKALGDYEDAVLQLEQDYMKDPYLPISHFLIMLSPYESLLGTLKALCDKINEKNVRGCQVLEVVHEAMLFSVARSRDIMQSVEQCCHAVLYDQLTHWLLYGLLLDPYQELFIKSSVNDLHRAEQDQDSFPVGEKDGRVTYPEIVFAAEMLPSHIPVDVAEKIIFIGESICVFEGESWKGREKSVMASHCGKVLGQREEEFHKMLQALYKDTCFSLTHLQEVVDVICKCVSEHLWTLVMEAGFVNELSDIKSIFLLGRGELFHTLIGVADKLLSMHVSNVYTKGINSLFQHAGHLVLLEDSILEKFSLTFHETGISSSKGAEKLSPADTGWKFLKINYSVKWPLYKLFSPSVQDKYNAIFNFLFDVRRAQHRLQHLWIIQMQRKQLSIQEKEQRMWTLRHHMSLLIDNFQYYLQVDVLDSQYWKLISLITSAKDYQVLLAAHQHFLTTITNQCFFSVSVITKSLSNILMGVHEFCTIIESSCLPSKDLNSIGKLSETQQARIEQLTKDFERGTCQLVWILSNMRNYRGSQYTVQLIMKIDYSHYYSRNPTMKHLIGTV